MLIFQQIDENRVKLNIKVRKREKCHKMLIKLKNLKYSQIKIKFLVRSLIMLHIMINFRVR